LFQLVLFVGASGCASSGESGAVSGVGGAATAVSSATGSGSGATSGTTTASGAGGVSNGGSTGVSAGASSGVGAGGATGGAPAGGASGSSGGSGAGGSTGGSGGSGGVMANCETPATLKEAGSCTERLVGVALSAAHLAEGPYAEAALEFNYVTPENEMKWDVTEPTQNGFTFELGDQIVDFAVQNGMKVKGHALVWHNQLPQWLTSMTNADQIRSAMINHIQGVMEYYRGKVIAWDVVNEAFDDDGSLRDSIFSRYLGDSFIEAAFRAASEADPDVKLYYNDYDIESAYDKADSAYELVRDFVERGVPIDGVGMQMHTRTTDEDPPLPEFEANLQRIVDLGLEVVLSEMDVRLCADGTFEQQRTRYHDLIEVCMNEPKCTAITIWGITDQYSFLNERTDLQCAGTEPPRPLLWDDDYDEKPAYTGVMDALLGR
jgi:endo-1,4-beta-xylanase